MVDEAVLRSILLEWERNREAWNMIPDARERFIKRSVAALAKPVADDEVREVVERLHDHARNVGGDDSYERLYGSEAIAIAALLQRMKDRTDG